MKLVAFPLYLAPPPPNAFSSCVLLFCPAAVDAERMTALGLPTIILGNNETQKVILYEDTVTI